MPFNHMPLQMEWFYNLCGYKTKINWFLMEIALEYYSRIRDSRLLAAYRAQYDEKQVAQFCAYYARRLKESVLRYVRGQRKNVILYREYIEDFYPHHSELQNKLLGKVAKESFDHMASACEHCPQQCLRDYMSRSHDFTLYKD